MLHFCSRITFCMDVGNFFQFQCTFQCNGVVITSSQIEKIVCVSEYAAYVLYSVSLLQQLLHFFRHGIQFFQHLSIAYIVDGASFLAQSQRQHGQHSHLSCKSFCGSHTNLWTHVNVRTCICGSRNAAAYGIADAVDECSFRFCQFNGG